MRPSVILVLLLAVLAEVAEKSGAACPKSEAIQYRLSYYDNYHCRTSKNCKTGYHCCHHHLFAHKICLKDEITTIGDLDDEEKHCPPLSYSCLFHTKVEYEKLSCWKNSDCQPSQICCKTFCSNLKICVNPEGSNSNNVVLQSDRFGQQMEIKLPTLPPARSSNGVGGQPIFINNYFFNINNNNVQSSGYQDNFPVGSSTIIPGTEPSNNGGETEGNKAPYTTTSVPTTANIPDIQATKHSVEIEATSNKDDLENNEESSGRKPDEEDYFLYY